jgi:hypothetical protein
MYKKLVGATLATSLLIATAQPVFASEKLTTSANEDAKSAEEALTEDFLEQLHNFHTLRKYYVESSVDPKVALKKAFEKDTYLKGVCKSTKITVVKNDDYQYVNLEVTYQHHDYEEGEVLDYAKMYTQDISKDMSDVEKVKTVHDHIVRYAEPTPIKNTVNMYSPFAIVKEQNVMSSGYAMLAYRMLEAAGLEVKYVTGKVRNQPHAWNLVKVDGQWYHLDTALDDPILKNEKYFFDYVRYDYFLVSEKTILNDHTIDAGYPKASNTNYAGDLRGKTTYVSYGDNKFFNLVAYTNGAWYYSDPENEFQLIELKNGRKTVVVEGYAFMPTYANGNIYYMDDQRRGKAYNIASGTVTDLNIRNVKEITNYARKINFLMDKGSESIDIVNKDIQHQTPSNVSDEDDTTVNYGEPIIDNDLITYPVVPEEEEPEELYEDPETDDEETPNISDDVYDDNDDEPQQTPIEAFETFLDRMPTNMLYSSFSYDAETLLDMLDNLSKEEIRELSAKQDQKLALIKEKYKKLNSFAKKAIFKRATTTTSDEKKKWTFTLKSKVKNNEANRQKVKMYNQFGEKVPCVVTISGKKVKVSPKKSYVTDTPYVIHIPSKLTKSNGKAYGKNVYLKFEYEAK